MTGARARRVLRTRIVALSFAAFAVGLAACAGSTSHDEVDRMFCVFHPPLAAPMPSILFDRVSSEALMEEALSGSSAAARVLAERYERGEGVPADAAKAALWYRSAAIVVPEVRYVRVQGLGEEGSMVPIGGSNPPTPGDPIALRRLAEMYRQGTGLPRNIGHANVLNGCADNFDTLLALQERQRVVR